MGYFWCINPLNAAESNVSIFRREQHRFHQLCLQVHSKYAPAPRKEFASPKRVLAFAEGLLLCQTEAEALVHIEQDREAAEFFRIRSGDVARAFDAASALDAKEVSIREGPFCLLAEMLLKSFRLSAEELDDRWNKPDGTQSFSV